MVLFDLLFFLLYCHGSVVGALWFDWINNDWIHNWTEKYAHQIIVALEIFENDLFQQS